MANYEPIYDEKISPLMDRIINICKENGISMISSFKIADETEEENNYYCTTCLPGDKQPQIFKDAFNVLYNNYVVEKPFFMAATITSK